MSLWLKDPKDGTPSVTLTLVVLATLCTVVAGFLEVFGQTKTTSLFNEFMYSTLALYLGRRIGVGGKSYTSDKAEEIEKTITKDSK